jgi:hypothetical protein
MNATIKFRDEAMLKWSFFAIIFLRIDCYLTILSCLRILERIIKYLEKGMEVGNTREDIEY